LIWPKKVTSALTSDLFDVLFLLLHAIKSEIPGEATPAYKGQNYQIGRIFRDNCSEKQF
jgi:hypothetical protein